jgi:hypothetical protein
MRTSGSGPYRRGWFAAFRQYIPKRSQSFLALSVSRSRYYQWAGAEQSLGETFEAEVVVRALRNALILRQPNPALTKAGNQQRSAKNASGRNRS